MGSKAKPVGGQAVIEGVMMRGFGRVATAVRDPGGGIAVTVSDSPSVLDRHRWLNVPLVRGAVTLAESLALGLRSLSWSARMSGEDDEGELSSAELALTMLAAIALAGALFVALPTVAAGRAGLPTPLLRHLAEGAIRMGMFLAYLAAIARMDGIHRVFQYHGAEHKAINAYEAHDPLTVANVQRRSRFHPRCGTSFLLIVMVVSVLVFSLTGWSDVATRVAGRVLLMPLVAGVSYEVVRYASRHDSALARLLTAPGLWLQRLTTVPPDDEMVEVAIRSLRAVLPPGEEA